MMKTINKILALAACCLSVASCNDENLLTQERESWQGNDKISLSLTAAPETRAGDSRAVDVTVDEGTDPGYKIKDFVIFQFDENGNRIVDPKYYEYAPDVPGDPGQTIPVVLPTADGVEYTVVVLANYHEKLSASAFADATTLNKLMEKYQKFEKLSDSYKPNGTGYDLLMNGFAKLTKATNSLNMILYRNVAKLTINIDNNANSGVILKTAQVRSLPTKNDFFYHVIDSLNQSALNPPYPKRSIYTTFDYDVDEFTVNPGDNYQLVYYLPCHLMGKSSASSEKTKGINAPDFATFVELYGISEDGTKYSRYRFYLGDDMINDYNIRPNYNYTLPIKIKNIGNPQNDSRVEIVGAVVEEPDANSYIINPLPSEFQRIFHIPAYIRINTYWQNELIAGNIASSTGYTIQGDDQWSADIIWQTSDQQMIQFVNEDGSLTGNNGNDSPIYYGQKTLNFKPVKGAQGNLVIGVYRKDQTNANNRNLREYSWSWHLWITDYNPDECKNINWEGRYKYILSNASGMLHHYRGKLWDSEDAEYHNKWVMDRNLGAMEPASANNDNAIGMRYQYGRKDPLVYRGAQGSLYYYDSSSNSFKTTSWSNTVSYIGKKKEYMVKYPYNFYVGYTNDEYWQNLWDDPDWNKTAQGGKTKKSFFDPCPPGWRIPTKESWEQIISPVVFLPSANELYLDGIKGGDNAFLLNYSPNLETYSSTYGVISMHFSTPNTPSTSLGYFKHNETWSAIGDYYGARYRGRSIRPVQE